MHTGAIARPHTSPPAPMSSCLWDAVTATWVSLFEAFFARKEDLQSVRESLDRSRVVQELEEAEARLCRAEAALEGQITAATLGATECKRRGDPQGARKKILSRRSLDQQLQKLRGSQGVITMHLSTLRSTEMNRVLVETLRSSGRAMRRLSPEKDIREIEDVMFDLEAEMRNAKDLSDVLSKSIAVDDVGFTMEEELERELEGLDTGEEPPAQNERAASPVLGQRQQAALEQRHSGKHGMQERLAMMTLEPAQAVPE